VWKKQARDFEQERDRCLYLGETPLKRPQVTVNIKSNYFIEMCSGSEAGSYLRLIDFEYH